MNDAELRAALGRRDAYPDRPPNVELRETHISWVFLAGARAYKLKKPLVLPFLDYGTPERRRQMCEEEVRLNRRLAPDVYLGVRGVAASNGGVELTDSEDPRAIDFLVEMRRYDERRTVAAQLERGELTRAQIREVARTLALFHADCAQIDGADHGALRIEREVDRNIEELLGATTLSADRHHVRLLARFMSAFVVSHREDLDARAAQGLVRDCHGDLRAEHVLLESPVKVVDCVEFDPSLRALDVADDLAFLVMDLAALGGERFAKELVEAYRAAGGDCGEDSLLSFFAVHRALVRAKVLLARAAQLPGGSAAHGHISAQARESLALAECYSWGARLPMVIVVCGVPASGKSHLASALAHASRLPLLSSDVVRKRLAGIRPTSTARAEHYSEQFNRATYRELGLQASAEVRRHGGALVDATFRHRRDRQAFAEALAGAAPVLFVECLAPVAVLVDRALRRRRDPGRISDADLDVVLREREQWEPLEEVHAFAHLPLRTDRPLGETVEDLRALLDRRLEGGQSRSVVFRIAPSGSPG